MKKKPKKGARPDARPQTKLEPVDSFFNFFKPPQVTGRGGGGCIMALNCFELCRFWTGNAVLRKKKQRLLKNKTD